MLDANRDRRAGRLLDTLIANRTSVELGEITRQIETLDLRTPVLAGETAIGGFVSTLHVTKLLRRRGFVRCGHNGKSGLYREPVYSNGG